MPDYDDDYGNRAYQEPDSLDSFGENIDRLFNAESLFDDPELLLEGDYTEFDEDDF